MVPYYEHAGITIYHGDSREILPRLGFGSVVTDPPYGIGWKRSDNAARGSKADAGIRNDHDTTVRDEVLALCPDTPAIVFGSFYAPFPERVRQVLVWHKPADSGLVGSVTGFRRDAEPIFLVGPWPVRRVKWSSVVYGQARFRGHAAAECGHPHTKPVDLMGQLIQATPEGPVIDPFMGSGSTLVAAKSLGRQAIGIELEERYCEIAVKRLAQDSLFAEAA